MLNDSTSNNNHNINQSEHFTNVCKDGGGYEYTGTARQEEKIYRSGAGYAATQTDRYRWRCVILSTSDPRVETSVPWTDYRKKSFHFWPYYMTKEMFAKFWPMLDFIQSKCGVR